MPLLPIQQLERNLGVPSVAGALLTSGLNGQRSWSSWFVDSGTGNLYKEGSTTGISAPFSHILSLVSAGTARVAISNTGGVILQSSGTFGFSSTSVVTAAPDLVLLRDAANTLAQRNGTNNQRFNLYWGYTDGSNYGRISLFVSDRAYLQAEGVGTGLQPDIDIRTVNNKSIYFATTNTARWRITGDGHFLAGTDNTYDIGASGATRPRNVFLAGYSLQSFLVEANTAGSGAPNVLVAAESRSAYSNEGSTAQNFHTLPTAVAGLSFTFCVQDADGMRIVAAAGDTIRIGANASPAAGYVESTTIGDALRLLAINATEWLAVSVVGAGWTVST